MASKEKVIKLTRDGKFHAMGLVVNTWEQAVERCNKKGNTSNMFLVFPREQINGLWYEAEVCGPPEYLKQFLQ